MILPKKIIVIGGNAAGPAAAAKAKRVNPNAEVILFEAGNFISTGTCELPYAISDEVKHFEDLIFFNPQSFEEKKNVKVYTNNFVEEIDRRKKSIKVRDLIKNELKIFSYDSLIITTGSKTKKLPQFPDHLKNVFSFKNLNDLVSVKNFIEQNKVKEAFVIGAGYVGIELSDVLSKSGIEVSLVEKEQLPMPSSEPEISGMILSILKKNGIKFFPDKADIEPLIYEQTVKAIKLDGRFVDTDLVLIAAGFYSENYLAVQAKLEIGKSGGLKVDKLLKTSDSSIYAAGDCIEVVNAVTGKSDYIPLAIPAYIYGHIAGENAAGGNVHVEPVVKNISVRIFDKYFAEVGLTSIDAQKSGLNFKSVEAATSNLVKVMPGSEEVFGKILFEKNNRRIIGASLLGGKEISGYADIISGLIQLKQPIDELRKINFNYTPTLSPFINLLSLLGKKAGSL
jgi:NADPH-dependent 2,4-dienoyl-CoA reductase/sulfur reductase-like enzyme